MKNKVFKMLSIYLACMLLFTVPIYAAEEESDWVIPVTVQSPLLPRSVKESSVRVYGITRGEYFSAATLTIGNPNSGTIAITADVICSSDVDKIIMKVYLDVQKNGKWTQEESWGFTGHDVAVVYESFTYEDFKPGYSYRLRGSYAVYEGNSVEKATGITDGIYCE